MRAKTQDENKNSFTERPHENEKKRALNYVEKLLEEARLDPTSRSEDIAELTEIHRLLNNKKYGLVWEEHAEKVEEEMKTKIPVFVEDESKKISDNPDSEDYNFLLEGDNLHSLHLLEKTHAGKIDVIYIDPPYNTGTKEGAFRYNDKLILNDDTYIHSKWLSFMATRLKIAVKLLSNRGVLFLHIDENEYAQIKILLDEIMGESAFVENLIWNKRVPKNDKGIGAIHEYVLIYAKNIKNEFMIEKEGLETIFSLVEKSRNSGKSPLETQNTLKKFYRENDFPRAITLYNNVDNNFRIYGKINMSWPNANTFGPRYDVLHPKTNKPVKVPDRGWRWRIETLKVALDGELQELEDGSYIKGKIWYAKDERTQISSINYLEDTNRMLLRSIVSLKSDGSLELEKLGFKKNDFAYAKPVTFVKTLIESITFNDKEVTIFDFFAGSGTTGQAVIELNAEDGGNRRFILATNNENNIAEEVTYERMKRVSAGTEKYKAHPMNLKYFKTAMINKEDENLEKTLLSNVKTLIELQHGVDLSNSKIAVVVNRKEAEELSVTGLSTVYMRGLTHQMLDEELAIKFSDVKIIDIPETYFPLELKEAGF